MSKRVPKKPNKPHFKPHLCCGMFFNMLFLCSIKSQFEIITKFAHLLDNNFLLGDEKSFKTTLVNFRTCKKSKFRNLPFDRTAPKHTDAKQNNEEIFKCFEKKIFTSDKSFYNDLKDIIEQIIDTKEINWLGRVLLEIIDKDDKINEDASFYVSYNNQITTKKELIKMHEFNFYSFIIGILHFSMKNCYDNTVGKDTFNYLYNSPKNNSQYEFNKKIGNNNAYNQVFRCDLDEVKEKHYKSEIESSKFKENIKTNCKTNLNNNNANDNSMSIVSELKDNENLTRNRNHNNNQLEECIKKYKKNYYDNDSYITTIIDPLKKIKFDDVYVQNSITKFSDNYFTNQEKALRMKYSLQKHIHSVNSPIVPIESADSKTLLKENNYLLLTGTEGMGKSMYLRNLYLKDLKKQDILPILILLRSYTNDLDSKSLLDIIIDKIDISHIGITAMDFKELLNNYHVVLYLDGLDEINIKNGTLKATFTRKLKDFITQFSKVQIIISSRPDYEENKFSQLEMFTQYYLEEFCDENAYTYVYNIWLAYPNIMQSIFKAHAPALIDISKLSDRDCFQNAALYDEAVNFVTTYQEFARSPLFLTIILNLYKEDFTSTSLTKNEIYLKHFDMLYRNGITKNKLKKYPSKEELKFIIEELSYKMLGTNFYDISKEKLYDIISELTCYDHNKYDSRDLEIIICEDLAYINCMHEKYNFIHNSFKEFFAAMYLIEQNSNALPDLVIGFNDIGENSVRSVLDFVKNGNINILNEYLFIPYFKDELGYKVNNLSYHDFLKKFRNELILHSGEVNGNYIFEYFDTMNYYFFDYYLEYIENITPDYYYEDTSFDEIYKNSDGINNTYHYTMTFFKVEKIDYSANAESHSTPDYIDIIPDYEAEAFEHNDTPCGISCIINNISDLPKEYYPNLYNLIYNDDNFIYKQLYLRLKKYLQNNIQKFEDNSEKSKYLKAMLSKFSQVNVILIRFIYATIT